MRAVQWNSWATSLLAIAAVLLASGPGFAKAASSPADTAARVDKLLQDDIANSAKSVASKPATTAKASSSTATTKPVAAGSKSWKSDSVAGYSYKSAKPAAVAKPADDETYLRRVSMDLIGKPPTPAEITAFALDPAPDKRAKAVDRLLARPEFGENWGRYWRDVILYRRADDRAVLASVAISDYMAEQFNRTTPWDEVARSFITATGDVRENGATGIVMAQFGSTPDITAEVSRIFMAIQIQCAQCHDHPFDRWKRTQFHELAAFFPRIALRPVKPTDAQKRSFDVIGLDRERPKKAKNANVPRGELEHYMPDLKNPAAKGTLMKPVFFVTGQQLPLGTPDAQRRATIARWITSPQDEWFAKAFVNRIWAEMVGEGFYEPVDDIGPDRDCSAPETLDFLAKQFVAHRYDVKWLYRTIAASSAYQLDSRSRHLPGQTPFQANCPQLLRADEVFDALVSALGIDNERLQGKAAGGKKNAYGQPRTARTLFDYVFGYDPSVRRDEVSGSIPQALVLMNSPQLARAENANSATALGKLLSSTKDDAAVVEELYLRSLAREPKSDEAKTCLDYVKKTGDRKEAFEDIQWALVNSTEFLHRK
ncbi:MAG TPA: DUF1549 domain-containing protein [Pirellulales bacterium]|nr:DUF1549 domain-containing protein [Pirellulales bacterium]